jgi:uncharacterized protein involved in outer membrane biogenesis
VWIVSVPVSVLIIAVVYVVGFSEPVPLNFLKQPLNHEFQQMFGRNLDIQGDIILIPRLRPSLEITDVTLDNPAGMKGDFLHAQRMFLQLNLFALLEGDLDVGELTASDIQLSLLVDEQGQSNWDFLDGAKETDSAVEDAIVSNPSGQESAELADIGDFNFNLDKLELDNINVSYIDHRRSTEFVFAVNRGLASVKWDSPMTLSMKGHSNQIPVELKLEATPASSLFNPDKNWEAVLDFGVREVDMKLAVTLIANSEYADRQAGLGVEIQGANLRELEEILEIPFPPWGPYELGGNITLTDTGYHLREFNLKIGQSNLSGDLKLELVENLPTIGLQLHSKLIDTGDFPLNEWAGLEYDSVEVNKETNAEDEQESLLDPAVLDTFDADIDIVFDEIRSGTDTLGKGSLNLAIGAGRLELEKFEATIPGGVIKAGFSLEPGEKTIVAKINIEAKEFDFGILARRTDPESKFKGRLFLDVNLEGESDSLENMMVAAKGKIGMAVWPEEFEAGIFDLWAVGLLSAAAGHYGDPSLVNCLVARFSIEDGIMEQDAILIDTSQIRVVGDGVVNFHEETFDFYLVPKSKKAALISAATPVEMKGSFEDFELGVKSSDLTKSVFRNAMNVVLLGVPLIFHKSLEADGSEACHDAMVNDIDLKIKNQQETP